jgi:hypothetical protein
MPWSLPQKGPSGARVLREPSSHALFVRFTLYKTVSQSTAQQHAQVYKPYHAHSTAHLQYSVQTVHSRRPTNKQSVMQCTKPSHSQRPTTKHRRTNVSQSTAHQQYGVPTVLQSTAHTQTRAVLHWTYVRGRRTSRRCTITPGELLVIHVPATEHHSLESYFNSINRCP